MMINSSLKYLSAALLSGAAGLSLCTAARAQDFPDAVPQDAAVVAPQGTKNSAPLLAAYQAEAAAALSEFSTVLSGIKDTATGDAAAPRVAKLYIKVTALLAALAEEEPSEELNAAMMLLKQHFMRLDAAEYFHSKALQQAMGNGNTTFLTDTEADDTPSQEEGESQLTEADRKALSKIPGFVAKMRKLSLEIHATIKGVKDRASADAAAEALEVGRKKDAAIQKKFIKLSSELSPAGERVFQCKLIEAREADEELMKTDAKNLKSSKNSRKPDTTAAMRSRRRWKAVRKHRRSRRNNGDGLSRDGRLPENKNEERRTQVLDAASASW